MYIGESKYSYWGIADDRKHSKRQLSTAKLKIFATQSFLGAAVY
jgi:hypothetical protein